MKLLTSTTNQLRIHLSWSHTTDQEVTPLIKESELCFYISTLLLPYLLSDLYFYYLYYFAPPLVRYFYEIRPSTITSKVSNFMSYAFILFPCYSVNEYNKRPRALPKPLQTRHLTSAMAIQTTSTYGHTVNQYHTTAIPYT